MPDPIGLRHTNFVHCCPRVIGNGQRGLMISLRRLGDRVLKRIVSHAEISCDGGDMPSLEELGKLVEAEYLVPKINARIDEQRQVVENLATQGHDITSAKIVLDSLLMSLFLCVQERQRLRVADSNDEGSKAA